MITLQGLPQHLKNYSLAVFQYAATGEGVTNEIQLICHPKQPVDVGYEEFEPHIIPATIEKTTTIFEEEYKFLDWNPEFKAEFFANFGLMDWEAFKICCVEHKGYLNLIKKLHYNLS